MNASRYDCSTGTMSAQGTSFNEVWPQIEPLVKSIFTNDRLSKSDWQEIFWKVHSTCMWDPHSAYLLQLKLRELFSFYIKHEQNFIFTNAQTDLSLMKAYMVAWKRFMFYYTYVPLPFAPLEKLVFDRGGPVGDNYTKNEETDNFLRLSMMEMWVLYIFSKVSTQLVHGAMMLVDAERRNLHSDPQLIVGVKESCVYLCKYLPNRHYIYRNNFESVYLASIESFYQTKGQEYYAKHGVLQYIKWVSLKIKEEIDRANRYLEPQSLAKVIASCVNTLVARYKELFADKFLDLIKCNDIASLNLMFMLLDRVDSGFDILLERFEKYLTGVGTENLRLEAMTIAQDSEKYIESLLKLFNMATKLINEAFNSDPRFLTTRDISINTLINDKSIFAMAFSLRQKPTLTATNERLNENPSNVANETNADTGAQQVSNNNNNNNNPSTADYVEYSTTTADTATNSGTNAVSAGDGTGKKSFDSRNAELFANYCDILLRRNTVSRHLSSEQIEAKLKNVILLLKYLQDKDVFIKFYKAHLTRRLILDVSVDLDKEEQMVAWLREVGMPADYVNKISRMFQDLKVSDDFNHQFRTLISGVDRSLGDLITVKILNSSTWSRNYEKVNVTLPAEIEELLPRIETFYKNKHSGRNLFWHHHFSYGVITFNSDAGSYDLEVTSYQAAILHCWNDRPADSISLETLSLSTQLPILELRKTIWSLVSNAKLKLQLLLIETGAGHPAVRSFKDLRDDTKFRLNLKFSLVGKTGRPMKRGRFNLIGRLQLLPEKFREEETESIIKLRTLRTQEAIMKIMKTRKTITFSALQLELTHVLKEMFVPGKQLIKDQLDWLLENDYLQRDATDANLINYC